MKIKYPIGWNLVRDFIYGYGLRDNNNNYLFECQYPKLFRYNRYQLRFLVWMNIIMKFLFIHTKRKEIGNFNKISFPIIKKPFPILNVFEKL